MPRADTRKASESVIAAEAEGLIAAASILHQTRLISQKEADKALTFSLYPH
jgi:hypothetical protein